MEDVRNVDGRGNSMKAQGRMIWPLHHVQRFRDDETGALIYFGLILSFIMLMMGGVAVDVMRHERTRTNLQQTMDRSVLAAASLNQTLSPKAVVIDYFAKAGLSEYLNPSDIQVTEFGNAQVGYSFRKVTTKAVADTKPLFMHLVGIDQFDAGAASTAEQAIDNIEISLVLDISGSMVRDSYGNDLPYPSKLDALKDAAKEFVDTVLKADTQNRTTISLVPYNGQVNLGTKLMSYYNVSDKHTYTDQNCVDMPASVYTSRALSTTLEMPMTGNVDSFSDGLTRSGNNLVNSYQSVLAPYKYNNVFRNKWCTPNDNNKVRVLGSDIGTLQGQIEGLTGNGATSINAGLRWGLALLDPGTRSVVTGMRTASQASVYSANRPMDYQLPGEKDSAKKVMKVIVLMTDGEHFEEEQLNDGYRAGNAPIYLSNDGYYSIYHVERSGTKKYWVPHLSGWYKDPYNNGTQQTWPKVWEKVRLKWVAYQLYARALNANKFVDYTDMLRTQTDTTVMDTQLQSMCDLAKQKNVFIFGIAFEAPTHGQETIEDCSTQLGGYYFNASDKAALGTAFRAIASQITQLRLTQ